MHGGSPLVKYTIESIFMSNYTKQELDAAAQLNGFPDADFPFYSTVNGCGPDGWKNQLVPEKSHIWSGVEFTESCNMHDRAYMTLGKPRGEADDEFRNNLNKAVDRYLNATVEQTFERVVKRVVIDRVPRQVTRRVVEQVKKRVKDILKPWKWIEVIVEEARDIVETVYDEVQREVEETVKDIRMVPRASMLSPARIAEMKGLVEVYYLAVSKAGQPFYNGSQAKQASYEEWLADFAAKNPR
jgi:hypothetical protein